MLPRLTWRGPPVPPRPGLRLGPPPPLAAWSLIPTRAGVPPPARPAPVFAPPPCAAVTGDEALRSLGPGAAGRAASEGHRLRVFHCVDGAAPARGRGSAQLTVPVPGRPRPELLQFRVRSSGVEPGWGLPEPGPLTWWSWRPSSFPVHALEKERSLGGGGLQGGRFEIAAVEQRQPKITMGPWGGWDPEAAAGLAGCSGQPSSGQEEPMRTYWVCAQRAGTLCLASFTV